MDVNVVTVAVICLVAVLVLMMVGIPLPWAVGASAIIGAWVAWGGAGISKVGLIVYTQFFNLQWTPLPLFTLLACVINETQIGDDVFNAANKWMGRVPGGLVVASIAAEAGMAATIGSSSTTALAVGKVSLPQMERLGYNRDFAAAAILTGGVLGPLIPPSIPMIVYGIMSRTSVAQLFIAGVMPGILLAAMLAGYAIFACTVKPQLGPRPSAVTWRERILSLKRVWPVIIIFLCVLGSIYMGIATATEAAGVACVVTMIIAIIFYKFRWSSLVRVVKETVILNGMIAIMIIAVVMFTYVVGTSGMAEKTVNLLVNSGLSRWGIMVAIQILLLFLGCFVDGLTIILLTLPFLVPLVSSLGFSLVWFGVLMTVNIEIGLITPPMGLNLFIIKEAFHIPINKLLRATLPFLAVEIFFLVILVAFPQISTWLPGMMMGS
jgi:tripartite ATP-independent transporter DctM subunit